LIISSNCIKLVLPELFEPKNPVIGASLTEGNDFHDLKFVVSMLAIILAPDYAQSIIPHQQPGTIRAPLYYRDPMRHPPSLNPS
jgi:hypothetical protein